MGHQEEDEAIKVALIFIAGFAMQAPPGLEQKTPEALRRCLSYMYTEAVRNGDPEKSAIARAVGRMVDDLLEGNIDSATRIRVESVLNRMEDWQVDLIRKFI